MSKNKTTENQKKIVFSGTRATGRLHLGNYLGAVKGYIELSENPNYETYFMAVDIHTITTPYEHQNLKQSTRDIIMDYLAAGLDPEKATITVQSLVPEHMYLSFLFSSQVTVAHMSHLPTYKEKKAQHPENVTMALLNYPVLMAADILVYRASLVPVGVDQEPHLEVAREIARKMNHRFFPDQDFFPEPQRFATKGEYVPSLDGQGKMSKSIPGSYINLMDSEEEILVKVMKIPTDSGQGTIKTSKEINDEDLKVHLSKSIDKYYFDQNSQKISAGVGALLTLVELFQGSDKRQELEEKYISQGLRYNAIKEDLAQKIYQELAPIQTRRRELEKKQDYVDQVVKSGAKKARKVAKANLETVMDKMGLGFF